MCYLNGRQRRRGLPRGQKFGSQTQPAACKQTRETKWGRGQGVQGRLLPGPRPLGHFPGRGELVHSEILSGFGLLETRSPGSAFSPGFCRPVCLALTWWVEAS